MSAHGEFERGIADVAAARHPTRTEWFWAELRLLRDRWEVVRHPFGERWTEGLLSAPEQHVLAEEHDHLLTALAAVARTAAGKASGLLADTLADHAADLEARLARWRRFAAAAGWGAGAAWHFGGDPLAETLACARVWRGERGRPLATDLVTLHAIESAQPDGGRTDLLGAALEGVLPGADPFALLAQAEAAHRAHHDVLDALERAEARR